MDTQERSEREQEEDFLEQLYIWNQKGIYEDTRINIDITANQDTYNQRILNLREKGLLTSVPGELRLSTYGQEKAEMILNRHYYLTAFLQIICNVSEKTAEENACRMEHVISEEIFMGICSFMRHGYEFSHNVKVQNLRYFYENGDYTFPVFLYEPEARYPRIFCRENEEIQSNLLAVIGEESFFFLMPKETFPWEKVWYMDQKDWQEAKKTKKGYQMPGNIFTYSISNALPMAEGNAYIAFTNGGEPKDADIRELNIHLLTEQRRRG